MSPNPDAPLTIDRSASSPFRSQSSAACGTCTVLLLYFEQEVVDLRRRDPVESAAWLAACHMFGIPFEHTPDFFPCGIYTIPEISMIVQTEETLTANKIPYEVGIARYSELAKSMMLGDEAGMLKLLFDPGTHKLLGVHALGQRATEIILSVKRYSSTAGQSNISAI